MQLIVNTSAYILSILISISIILQQSMSKKSDQSKSQKRPNVPIVQEIDDSKSDDSIEIVVAQKAPAQQRLAQQKHNALTFWMNRVRHQNKEKTIEIQDNIQTSALNSVKIPVSTTKASIPIVGHKEQREREKKNSGTIIIPESNRQQGGDKLKKSISKGEDKASVNPTSNPIYVVSQQEKKRRFEKQVQVVEEMNKPRWIRQKEKRKQVNQWKYPNSNTTQYRQDAIHKSTRSMISQASGEVAWSDYIRKREINKMKNRAAQELQKKKQKQHEQEQKRKRLQFEEAQCQKLIQGLLGVIPSKKIKRDEENWGYTNNSNDILEAQRQRDIILQKVNEQNNDDLQSGQLKQGQANQIQTQKIRRPRYGLKEVIKPYQSKAPQFINIVLGHNYSLELILPQTKRIPDIFESSIMYKNVFHYMITNQCIADVSGRLESLQKEKPEPQRVSITSYKETNEGQLQIYLKEIPQQERQFTLRNFSLSKYRIGLVTSQCQFSRSQYGIYNKENDGFGFLVMLSTPQTKQELKNDIKCTANCRVSELDWLFKKRKSFEAYYYDLEKITTHVREYLAISNIQHSELAHFIFNPMVLQKQMRTFVQNKEILNDILGKLQQVYNNTQFQSIRMMVRREKGIILLQGPPGTGKTSTLMGLLSAQYQYLKKTNDSRKIMVCAPSNAAVDHIVKRIQSEGLLNGAGEIVKPIVLRVGIVQSNDSQILAASLDNLCEEKMIAEHKIQQEMSQLTTPQIKEKIIALQKELRMFAGQQDRIRQKKSQITRYQNMLFTFRKQKNIFSRKLYNIYEKQYLSSAEIILTTLSSSGNEKLDLIRGQIACLIIDQAAQATQPNLVITLQTGVEKILLVGDPYQLPATCKSSDCNITLFNRSLFQRFLDANIKPYFLNIQYRMAPLIRQFPSQRFYQNRLVDAESLAQRSMPNFLECFKGRNVIFLDIKYGQQRKRGHSHINQAQGKAIGLIVKCMLDPSLSMGVITPYKPQINIIVRQSKNELRQNPQQIQMIDKSVMINTVDSFQGQQRDIIIVSTVRANRRGTVGFINDQRRINVSLTRSKLVLIVVGHGDTLGSNQTWNHFLNWVQSKRLYYQVHEQSELKPILRKVFQYANQIPIVRKKYQQLSTDVRRIERKQIQSEYFRRTKHIQKSIEPLRPTGRNDISRQEPLINKMQPPFEGNKYALDINQSNLIVQQKRKKQDEDQQFENLQNRMKYLEQQYKKKCSYLF